MNILVINCGSSSIKYKLYDMAEEAMRASGLIERIGEAESTIIHQVNGSRMRLTEHIAHAQKGVQRIVELLTTQGDPPPLLDPDGVSGVGHRVVHGGEAFSESVLVDQHVLDIIQECAALAPLHNPPNLAGLRAAMKLLPTKPQVAVFDTAFFQTMPPSAYHYALPYEWYEKHRIRRYGFHGTSHRYVALRAAQLTGKSRPNLITLHLGNGCSMACIRNGKAIDQTMGLTPLEGLMMGTRSGDFDPAIIFHLVRQGLTIDEVRTSLEKRSGLLGVSGVAADLRDVHEAALAGNRRAALAIDIFAHRASKYVGAFLTELDSCDAAVFTGGIGENAAFLREKILTGLGQLGIELDQKANDHHSRGEGEDSLCGEGGDSLCGEGGDSLCPFRSSTDASRTAVWVIPTNEELMIAQDTARVISQGVQSEKPDSVEETHIPLSVK